MDAESIQQPLRYEIVKRVERNTLSPFLMDKRNDLAPSSDSSHLLYSAFGIYSFLL